MKGKWAKTKKERRQENHKKRRQPQREESPEPGVGLGGVYYHVRITLGQHHYESEIISSSQAQVVWGGGDPQTMSDSYFVDFVNDSMMQL